MSCFLIYCLPSSGTNKLLGYKIPRSRHLSVTPCATSIYIVEYRQISNTLLRSNISIVGTLLPFSLSESTIYVIARSFNEARQEDIRFGTTHGLSRTWLYDEEVTIP